jgi:hypothetical protein
MSQCGSNARLRANAHARQPSTSSAASTAITTAPVDSGRSPLLDAALLAAVDCAGGVVGAGGLVAVGAAGVVAVAPPPGAVAAPDGAYVVVGAFAPPGVAPFAPDVDVVVELRWRSLRRISESCDPDVACVGTALAADAALAEQPATTSVSIAIAGTRASGRLGLLGQVTSRAC